MGDDETSLRDALKLPDKERLALRLPLMDASSSSAIGSTGISSPGWSARFCLSFASVVL